MHKEVDRCAALERKARFRVPKRQELDKQVSLPPVRPKFVFMQIKPVILV